MMSPDYCLALLYIFLSLYSIHNKDLHWIHNQFPFWTVRIETLVLVTTLFLFLNTVILSRLQVLPWILKCGSSVVLESQFHQKKDVKSRLRKISMNEKSRIIFHANETICINNYFTQIAKVKKTYLCHCIVADLLYPSMISYGHK